VPGLRSKERQSVRAHHPVDDRREYLRQHPRPCVSRFRSPWTIGQQESTLHRLAVGESPAACVPYQSGQDAQRLLCHQLRQEIRGDPVALRRSLAEDDRPLCWEPAGAAQLRPLSRVPQPRRHGHSKHGHTIYIRICFHGSDEARAEPAQLEAAELARVDDLRPGRDIMSVC
jgi:hypothetical protein